MKIIWIIFTIFLIVGVLFGSYFALSTGQAYYSANATAQNQTFVAETSNGFPTIWILAIGALVLGVVVLAFKR